MRFVSQIILFGALATGVIAQPPAEAPGIFLEPTLAGPASRIAADRPPQIVELAPTAIATGDPDGVNAGYNEPFEDVDVSSLEWEPLERGGQMLSVEFHSPSAQGLSVQVRLCDPRIEVRVYDPLGDAVHGPFFPGAAGNDGWWSPIMFGETMGLEFHAPEGVPVQVPEFLQSAHLNNLRLPGGFGLRGGPCAEDVACAAPEWQARASGVVLIFFNTGDGVGQCTASLISRMPADQAPLLLTAEHCMEEQAWASSLTVRWFYRAATCGGPPPDLNTLPMNLGGVLLKKHNDADESLIGLVELPVGQTFLPWLNQGWSLFQNMRGLHHALGGPLQYIEGNKSGDGVCAAVGSGDQENINVTLGAVGGGASGSPGFDTAGRIRGTLSCSGSDSGCTALGVSYGMLETFWSNAQWYLSSPANPCRVSTAAVNDPNGDGDSERGTNANPFNTVYEATFCVPSGGEVRIAPGVYPEDLMRGRTLLRPMTLTADGGTVVIGG